MMDEDEELVGDNGENGRFGGDDGGDKLPELEANDYFISP